MMIQLTVLLPQWQLLELHFRPLIICLYYFTFPGPGFSIALCPGDILIFNPQQHHSILSRCDPSKPIWCTSLYLKNAVVGGNNNNQQLDRLEKRAMEMLLLIVDHGNKEIEPITPSDATDGIDFIDPDNPTIV